MKAELLLTAIHVAGVVLWIGALAAMGLVATASGTPGVDAKLRGALGRRIYLKAAVPGFATAFVAGLTRLLLGWRDGYAHAPWMHSKLTLAVLVIALHHVIGARLKKMERDGAPAGPIPTLTIIALAASAGAIVFVIVRPF